MPLPAFLRRMDDRVLGDRLRRQRGGSDTDRAGSDSDARADDARPARRHDGLPTFLSVVYRISRLVFLLLALTLVIAIVLILTPANDANVIVRNVFDLAEQVAGPFADVFTVADPERMKIVNYGVAAAVYFVASVIVGRLPTGGRRG
jgi:hypothetical protein